MDIRRNDRGEVALILLGVFLVSLWVFSQIQVEREARETKAELGDLR